MSKGDGADSPFEQVMRELEQVSQSIGAKPGDVESAPPPAALVSTPEPDGGAGHTTVTDPQLRQSLEDIERSLDEQAARRNDMLARLRQSAQRTKTTAAPPSRTAKAAAETTRFDATAAQADATAKASAAAAASQQAPAPKPAQRPAPKPKPKTKVKAKAKASAVIPPRAAAPLNDSVREALARTEARRERLRNQSAAPSAAPKSDTPSPAQASPMAQTEKAAPSEPAANDQPLAPNGFPIAAQAPLAPAPETPPTPKAAAPKPVVQQAPSLALQSPVADSTTAPVQPATPPQAVLNNDTPAQQRRTPAPAVDVPGAPTPKNGSANGAPAPDFPNPFANIGAPTPAGSPVVSGAPAATAEQEPPAIMAPKARTGLVLNTAPMPKMFDGAPIATPPEPAFPASVPPPLEVERIAKAPPPFKPSKPSSTPSGVVADFAELGLDTPAPQTKPAHPPELGKGYVTQSYTFKPEDFVTPSASDAVLGGQKSKGGLWRTLRRTIYALAALAAVFAAQYYLLANYGGSQEDVVSSTLGTDLGSGFGEARVGAATPITTAPVDDVDTYAEMPPIEDTPAETATAVLADTPQTDEVIEPVAPAEPTVPQALRESAEAQSRERILQIQSLLKVMGYDVPDADGEVNTETLVAIQAFQTNRQIDGDDVGPRFMVELRLAAAEGHRAR